MTVSTQWVLAGLVLLAALGAMLAAVAHRAAEKREARQDQAAEAATRSNASTTRSNASTTLIDASFSIIGSSIVPGIKRSLDVRLEKKVSERTLRAIALKLKAQESETYDRTFVNYYLPGMAVGAGAWATTHFNPDLEVRILGLTAEDETKLVKHSEPPNRETIGRWLDQSPFVGSRITIAHDEGKLIMEQMFNDGSRLNRELVETKSPRGRRFENVEVSVTGDHWILGPDGRLQIRDNDGLVATAKKIE